jgi:hypothetical protein
MDDEVQPLLAEQVAYYRAHAPDYDDNYLGKDWGHSIEELPITGGVLELACGTGHRTRLLTARARSVTAVDAGPGGDAGLGHGVPVAWPVGLPCLGTGDGGHRGMLREPQGKRQSR